MEPDDRPGAPTEDPLREQLLEAAARVLAEKGYFGTKIMDIVRAAGLSSGAVYGRFASKDELMMEAILDQVQRNAVAGRYSNDSVTDILIAASRAEGPLNDLEATQVEAYIAARREPRVAAAISEARGRWRTSIGDPLIERAIADGSASPDADFDSIVFLLETLNLGLLVQRGAGQSPPDLDAWSRFLEQVIRGMAHPS
jgi:AcrR family transcriptional regulator